MGIRKVASDKYEHSSYKYIGTSRSKSDAEKNARRLRDGGMAARVARNGYGFYNVYARPRKK